MLWQVKNPACEVNALQSLEHKTDFEFFFLSLRVFLGVVFSVYLHHLSAAAQKSFAKLRVQLLDRSMSTEGKTHGFKLHEHLFVFMTVLQQMPIEESEAQGGLNC